MTDLGFELTLTVRDERTVVEFSGESGPVARSEDRDRGVALLRLMSGASSKSRRC